MENACCWNIWQTFSVRLLSRSALTFVCAWYQVYTCYYTGKPLVNLALSFLVLYQQTCQSKDFIQCKMCKLVLKCSVFWLIRVVLSSGFLIAMLSIFLDDTATATWCDKRHCRNVFVPCIIVQVYVYTGPLVLMWKKILAELDCWKVLQVFFVVVFLLFFSKFHNWTDVFCVQANSGRGSSVAWGSGKSPEQQLYVYLFSYIGSYLPNPNCSLSLHWLLTQLCHKWQNRFLP